MKGDFTATFKPEKHYSGVRMQQGRVLLDADFNEHMDIQSRLADRSHHIIGPCGGPQGVDRDGNPLAGFEIIDGTELYVTKGRYYVDGILCEIECEDKAIAITAQPDLPVASLADLIWSRQKSHRRVATWPTSTYGSDTSPRWRTSSSVRSPCAGPTPPTRPRPWRR